MSRILQAFVPCAGLGTRMAGALPDGVPKCMAMVAGKPVLVRILDWLGTGGIERAIVTLRAETAAAVTMCPQVSEHKVRVLFHVESGEPKGSLGSLSRCRRQLDDRFLLCYGDVLTNLDLGRLFDRRGGQWSSVARYSPSVFEDVAIVTQYREDTSGKGQVDVSPDGETVRRFREKPEVMLSHTVFGGVALVTRRSVPLLPNIPRCADFASELLQGFEGTVGNHPLVDDEWLVDAGTLAGIAEAELRLGMAWDRRRGDRPHDEKSSEFFTRRQP